MIKKMLALSLILVLQACTFALAEEFVIKINDVRAKPGETITVNIEINNSKPVVAFQMDIPLPLGFQYVPNSIALNQDRGKGHIVQANVLPDSNVLRIISFSMSNANYKGSDGVIASFTLKTPKATANFPLKVENAIVADVSATNLLTGTVDATVRLAGR
jgi:hypothetical protein